MHKNAKNKLKINCNQMRNFAWSTLHNGYLMVILITSPNTNITFQHFQYYIAFGANKALH